MVGWGCAGQWAVGAQAVWGVVSGAGGRVGEGKGMAKNYDYMHTQQEGEWCLGAWQKKSR